MKNIIYLTSGLLLLIGCQENEKEKTITSASDYSSYLAATTQSKTDALEQKNYWENRLTPDSTGIGDLGPLGASYEALFTATGNPEFLINAEKVYKRAIEVAAPGSKDGYIRALAKNYVSQHRFKEATSMLETSYEGISNKQATAYQLFDTYMEIGAYDKAYEKLEEVKAPNNYNYLIRQAKWNDYRGDLDSAINNLEKALSIAEASGNKGLKTWTYSNLGDFYGHAGELDKAYDMYLKTLAISPDDAYAKKGIAWLAYAADDDLERANEIINHISSYHAAPDYELFLAELAEIQGNEASAQAAKERFISQAKNPLYGVMYNAYLIELYAETNPEKALQLAEVEVENRPTPEAYHLLALAQLANHNPKKALEIIETHVKGKTYEPVALLHSAKVYKANGMQEEVKTIKAELMEASFELGPLTMKEVASL